MKYAQYVSLIKELEESASRNNRLYQYKVLGLAFLGYSYFAVIILLFLIVPASFLILFIYNMPEFFRILLLIAKLWWAFVPILGFYFTFLGGAIRALFAKAPEPVGEELTSEDAPELFTFVRTTSKALQAKFPEKILITDQFNAAVVTVPRFGMFGRKPYLILGLPLMQALSPEQFRAVIAHEIGHISGKHGVFGKWAYQLREAWGQFINSQEINEHKFSVLYEKFVNWFFPYFTAYSFVLMRNHERDADRDAVELIGAAPLGEGLITLELRAADIQEVFWKEIHEENMSRHDAPAKVFSRMLGSLAVTDLERDAQTLRKAVGRPTDYNDTHPSLAERLRTMGYWTNEDVPHIASKPSQTAGDMFIAQAMSKFVAKFDESWDESVSKDWKSRYDEHQKAAGRLEELKTKTSDGGELTAEELLETAGLVAGKGGNAEALPILERAVEMFPDNPEANYNLGGVLLALDNEEGLKYIDKVIQLDPKWKLAASDMAFSYLRSKGRFEDARAYAENVENEQETYIEAQNERSQVTMRDEFEPHSLSEDVVRNAVSRLESYEEIVKLYLVKKIVKYYPEIPLHVLVIELRKPRKISGVSDLSTNDILKIATERLNDGNINYFMVIGSGPSDMKPALEKIKGATIFER